MKLRCVCPISAAKNIQGHLAYTYYICIYMYIYMYIYIYIHEATLCLSNISGQKYPRTSCIHILYMYIYVYIYIYIHEATLRLSKISGHKYP